MNETATITEKRKAGRHKNGCTCEIHSTKNSGATVATAASAITANTSFGVPTGSGPDPASTAAVSKVKDELDVKLDHFQYTLDPEEAAIWEHDETLSPLHVPNEIKKKYPQFEWHWVSSTKLGNKGAGYNGWQLFKDSGHPDGIKRANDLFLGAMPKEMAESYRRRISERSTEMVKGIHEKTIAKMEQALGDLQDPNAGMLGPGESVAGREVRGPRQVVRRDRVGMGAGYLSREEVHEQIARHIEERKKNKVYSFQGQR